MRGCLTLVIGFVLGAALMFVWWPKPPTGTSRPQTSGLRIMVANSFISRVVERQPPIAGIAGFQDVQVSSSPPNALVAHLNLMIAGIAAPLTLELHPIARAGAVQVQLVAVRVGSVPVPEQVAGLLTNSVNRSLQHVLGSTASVTAVQVIPSGLEISADYR